MKRKSYTKKRSKQKDGGTKRQKKTEGLSFLELGHLYRQGKKPVERDIVKATEFYQLAAQEEGEENKNGEGQAWWANMLLRKGGLANEKKAVSLCQEAIAKKNALALSLLGFCYKNGLGGLKEDKKQSTELVKESACLGNARGQVILAGYYATGWGVEQDEKESRRLYQLAAEQGEPDAQYYLAGCYHQGYGMERDLKKAIYLYGEAAKQGIGQAQAVLGECYQDGIGVEKDVEEAVVLFKLAAKCGVTSAQVNLGLCFQGARGGLEQDLEEAVRLYQLAATQEYPEAYYLLGFCHQHGLGVETNLAESFRFYKTAASYNYSSAILFLATEFYSKGVIVAQDQKEALRLLRLAAALDDSWAQHLLAGYYMKGEQVVKDVNEARYYLILSNASIKCDDTCSHASHSTQR